MSRGIFTRLASPSFGGLALSSSPQPCQDSMHLQELLCLLPALVLAQSQFVEWGPPHGYKPEGCCATKRSYGIYEEKWQKTEFECRRQCEQTPKCQAYEHSAIKIRALAHPPIARCELHSEPIDHTVPCATAGFHFPVCYVKLTATRPILPPAPSPLASPAPPPRFSSAVAALRAYPDQLSAAKMDAWRAEAVLAKAEDALKAAPAGDPAAVKLAKVAVVFAESAAPQRLRRRRRRRTWKGRSRPWPWRR